MILALKHILSSVDQLGLITGMRYAIGRRYNLNRVINYVGVKHPIYLRPGTSDSSVFDQIFLNKEYNIKLGFEPTIIVDGGANIGLATVYFKNEFPNAKVIAIEPDIDNFNILKKNTENYKNVYTKQTGLWSKRTKTRLVDKLSLGKWGLVLEEYEEIDSINDTNTLTIDDIMTEFNLEHIDLLKLDIESAEKQIFKENYMSWLPKIKVIIIELHDWIADECSKTFFSAINNAFCKYEFSLVGENVVIINRDLLPKQIL